MAPAHTASWQGVPSHPEGKGHRPVDGGTAEANNVCDGQRLRSVVPILLILALAAGYFSIPPRFLGWLRGPQARTANAPARSRWWFVIFLQGTMVGGLGGSARSACSASGVPCCLPNGMAGSLVEHTSFRCLSG